MSFTSTVYKGVPFRYKLTARGYWDTTVAKSVTEDTTDTVTMTEYDGFSYTESESTVTNDDSSTTTTPTGVITIPDFILPNYMPCVGRSGFVGEAGKKWLAESAVYDGIVKSIRDYALTDSGSVSSVTGRSGYFYYDFDDNMVRIYDANSKPTNGVYVGDYSALNDSYPVTGGYQWNFSATNGTTTYSGTTVTYGTSGYLTADKTIPSSSYFGLAITVIAKVTPASTGNTHAIVGTGSVFVGTYGSKWGIYNGSWTTGSNTFTASTTYWIKAVQTYDESYTTTLYVLADDGYTLDTLPADGWTSEVSVSYAVFGTGDTVYLGYNFINSSSSGYVGVPTDLSSVVLYVSGSLYWQALGS